MYMYRGPKDRTGFRFPHRSSQSEKFDCVRIQPLRYDIRGNRTSIV